MFTNTHWKNTFFNKQSVRFVTNFDYGGMSMLGILEAQSYAYLMY